MNNPVYLVLPMLDISKFKMYGFWYDHLILKYGEILKCIKWTQIVSLLMQK